MILSMRAFEQALTAPELYFKRLQNIRVFTHNGRPIVRRTHTVVETDIWWNNRHYRLYLPMNNEVLKHIEALEIESRDHSRGPLIENIILHKEVKLFNSHGQSEEFDVVLQEIYANSMTLDKAVLYYKADDLRESVKQMKRRIDTLGFQHNNLKSTNILICKSGVARPLRYWYAEWRDLADNSIDEALAIIEQNRDAGICPLLTHKEHEECDLHRPRTCEGMTRCYKCGRYGFKDSDGYAITRYEYSWASDFHEGRAIVVKNNKMGAIDTDGKKIIHAIYDNLEFDVDTGVFTAFRDNIKYLIDYNGKRICRVDNPTEENKPRPNDSVIA